MAANKAPSVRVNGYALKAWRTDRGLTAQRLADATGTGMNRSRIAQIEGDHHRNLGRDLLDALAAALNVAPEALMVDPYGEAAA